VKQPIDGFIKIETEEDPKQIALDATQVAAEALNLQENYGISSLQRLDWELGVRAGRRGDRAKRRGSAPERIFNLDQQTL
jgi:hypothetical protein